MGCLTRSAKARIDCETLRNRSKIGKPGWIGIRDAIFVRRALEKLQKSGAWDKRPEYYQLSDGTHQTMTIWYRIIIGRRTDFEGWGTQYQAVTWKESGNRIEIVPWDRLLETAKAWLNFIVA